MVSRQLVIFGAAAAEYGLATSVTRKRGFAGYLDTANSKFTCKDGAVAGLQDSWHYTWQADYATQGGRCDGQKVSAEFVPMFIGVTNCPVKSIDLSRAFRSWRKQLLSSTRMRFAADGSKLGLSTCSVTTSPMPATASTTMLTR